MTSNMLITLMLLFRREGGFAIYNAGDRTSAVQHPWQPGHDPFQRVSPIASRLDARRAVGTDGGRSDGPHRQLGVRPDVRRRAARAAAARCRTACAGSG